MNSQQELVSNWIDALRSGDYAQGTGVLRSAFKDNVSYCCLGVLCEIAPDAEWDGTLYQYHGYDGYVSNAFPVDDWFTERTGLVTEIKNIISRGFMSELADANDEQNKDFNEIADMIEALAIQTWEVNWRE